MSSSTVPYFNNRSCINKKQHSSSDFLIKTDHFILIERYHQYEALNQHDHAAYPCLHLVHLHGCHSHIHRSWLALPLHESDCWTVRLSAGTVGSGRERIQSLAGNHL